MNSLQGSQRVRRLSNRTADHQVVGTGFEGVGGRHDALLIAFVGSQRTDTRCDQLEVGALLGFELRCLLRGADDAVEAAVFCEGCQAGNLSLRRVGDANAGKVVCVHAGEDSDSDQKWAISAKGFEALAASAHHLLAARSMDVHHPDAEIGCGCHGGRCGVGDIVKFQIQEHLESALLQILNQLRPGTREQLFAHFQAALGRIQFFYQLQGRILGGKVEGDDDLGIVRGLHVHLSYGHSVKVYSASTPCIGRTVSHCLQLGHSQCS